MANTPDGVGVGFSFSFGGGRRIRRSRRTIILIIYTVVITALVTVVNLNFISWAILNDGVEAGAQQQEALLRASRLGLHAKYQDSVLLSNASQSGYSVDLLHSNLKTLKSEYDALQKRVSKMEQSITSLLVKSRLSAANDNTTIVIATPEHPILMFLHIGKNGGTSFDPVAKKIAKDMQFSKYIGNKHYDWSHVEKIQREQALYHDGNLRNVTGSKNDTIQVVTMLREPVARAISHYWFYRKMSWTKGFKIREQTLSQYLFSPNNTRNLLATRDIWQDGQAAVSWLSGTHIASWVGVTKLEVPAREERAKNAEAMCHLAADRLEQTRWFGILEDLNRSLELLQHEFGLPRRPVMGRSNKNGKKPLNFKPNELEQAALASLMPQDIWLYEYSRRLFQARWDLYKNGTYVAPDRPPLPEEWSCASTRFTLHCNSGPLVPVL